MNTQTIKPYINRLPRRQKLLRLVWGIVCFFLFRPTPSWCLRKWRITLLRAFGASIGKGCAVYPSCRIWAPWNLKMGDYVCLAADVDCYTVARIEIGNKVTVSQRAFLCTASHDFTQIENPLIQKVIQINDFVWVASQAFVGPGVTVGAGAVVGACAVVVKDVEPWTVVAGNPARMIKRREIRGEEVG